MRNTELERRAARKRKRRIACYKREGKEKEARDKKLRQEN
jgi:hypothetical protein